MEPLDVQKEVTDKYSLRGRVYNRIREDILKGKYAPEEALIESRISKELGVSRTPVREALRQLELEELVSIIPNKGAIVNGISPKDIQDIYAIRSLIEGLSAKWAAANISKEHEAVQKLQENVELAEFYCYKENFEKLHELDSEFHAILYDLAESKILKHVLLDFHNYAKRVRKASIASSGRAKASIEEHKAIVEAIKNGDSKNAQTLMNRHVKNTAKNVLSHKLDMITETAEE